MPPRVAGMLLLPRRRLDQIDQRRAYRIGHRHMRHAAGSEEALLAREGAVDELVDEHEMPGCELLLQRPAGRHRHQVRHAGPLQGVDIGAVVDGRGRHLVAAAVAGQEADRQAVDFGKQNLVGRRSPRRLRSPPSACSAARAYRRARCRRRCRVPIWSFKLPRDASGRLPSIPSSGRAGFTDCALFRERAASRATGTPCANPACATTLTPTRRERTP